MQYGSDKQMSGSSCQVDAGSADVYVDWGAQLLRQGCTGDAVLALKEAVRLLPESAEAQNSLGVALRLEGRLDEAISHCREAVRLSPEMAEAHNNLGSFLQESGRIDESIASLREALRLQPHFANAHSNLGIALFRQHHYAEAVALYRQAIALDPQFVDAHNNLASALFALGEVDESLRCFSEAIRLKPDFREAHWGRALVWLSQGDFHRGWREFEWRPTLPEAPLRRPRWDGSDLHGHTVLLEAEQGLGDTLQFVRYGALVRQRGGRVVLACQPRLATLLKSCCATIDQVVTQAEPHPPFDVYLPLLSAPLVVGTTSNSVPAEVPYVRPNGCLVEKWRAELSLQSGFKIGIVWQGSPHSPGDRERSIPLAEFEPLARIPGVQLISLQMGRGVEQIEVVRPRFNVIDYSDRLDKAAGPFMDSAAIMPNLDLVVGCDSAVCHLAGAMAAPVWVAIPALPDWRWQLEGNGSPWYPTMRLFRQRRLGNWSDVFQRLASEIATLVASTACARR